MASYNGEPSACDVINTSLSAEEEPTGSVTQELEMYEAVLLLLLGFGGFSIFLAVGYNWIRRHIFRDVSSLDASFDAGGRVSMSLTAVTVGAQMVFPADLLHGATVTSKFGIAGVFWYATALLVNILLFPLLSMRFKTRAPGAKTFLQVVKVRYGKGAHAVFCFFALLTNLVLISNIIVSGVALFQALIKDMSIEMCVFIIAALFGSFSFIGGLGSTFYVSYFNAFVTFLILTVFVIRVFYLSEESLPFGDIRAVYERLTCLEGPEDNLDRSYVTFMSLDGLVWMIQAVFIAASVTFCDQAAWQSRIAAKPVQGVLGFLGATMLWFAIPTTIGTTAAITYLSFSAGNASLTLPLGDVDAGLVVPYVAQLSMGREGAFMIVIMFTMLMMSTGSGEVMGISSIIVYDIFQTYVCPYKSGPQPGRCILCGKTKKQDTMADDPITLPTVCDNGVQADVCGCPSVSECRQCVEDQTAILTTSGLDKVLLRYNCTVHGDYRTYQDYLVRLKSWTILWVTLALVPYGLLVVRSGVDLNWVLLTGGAITIPCLPGVVVTIVWVKATAKGVVIGAVSGSVCGIIAILARASTLPGGLDNFLLNTSEGYTVLAGSCTSFFVTLVITIVVSLCTHSIKTEDDSHREWQKIRDLDNPLRPWTEVYREEFPSLKGNQRPSFQQLEKVFRKAKVTAIVGSTVGIIVFVFIIPGVMASLGVLSASEFESWVTTMHVWCFVTAAVVILVTPMEEARAIWREVRRRKVEKNRM